MKGDHTGFAMRLVRPSRRTTALGLLLLATVALRVAGQIRVPVRPLALATGITLSGTAGAVTVAWTAAPGATSYRVQRATGSTASYTDLGHLVTTTAMVDTSAVAGVTFYYEVVSFFPSGAKSVSAPAAYTVPPPAKRVPIRKPMVPAIHQ